MKILLKRLFLLLLVLTVAVNTSVLAEEEDEQEEVELYSAVITAKSCAEKALKTGNYDILTNCPPVEAAKTGYVIFDPVEGEYYYVKLGEIYQYELDEGFNGNIDISGVIVGEKDGVPVIEPEDYSISPKPKAGFFKGCL